MPFCNSQIWLDEPLVTTASAFPSWLKSAVPLSVQPAGGVNATPPFRHHVGRIVHDIDVVALAALHGVGAGAAVEQIIAREATQRVVAAKAQRVAEFAANNRIGIAVAGCIDGRQKAARREVGGGEGLVAGEFDYEVRGGSPFRSASSKVTLRPAS